MPNQLRIPYTNPITYHEMQLSQVPQYISKKIEQYPFVQTIEDWEGPAEFAQPWQNSDTISEQVVSDFGPVNWELLDEWNNRVTLTQFTPVLQNLAVPGQWVYEHDYPLTTLPRGTYFIKLSAGNSSPTVLLSEPIFIDTIIPGSVYLEYRTSTYYGDVFPTGKTFALRVIGKVRLKQPSSDDSLYVDQPRNSTLLNSVPYFIEEFLIGGTYGIPDYLIKRILWAFGCDFKSIDGTQYEKSTEGAKWEEKSLEDYPMRAWVIDVVEAVAKSSQVYVNNTLQQGRNTIIAILDTTGVSNGPGSEQIIVQ